MNYRRREQFRVSRLAPRHGLRGARFDDDTSVIFDVGISSEKKDEHQTKLVQPGLETRSGESLHGSNRTVVLQTDHAFEVSSIVGRASNFRLVTVDGFPTTIASLHFGPGSKAREVFELYAAGAGTDLSIGFVPLGSRGPTEEEEAIGVREVITRARLLEVSLVAVGSNPLATTLLSQAAALTRAVRALGSPSIDETRTASLEIALLQARLAAIRMRLVMATVR